MAVIAAGSCTITVQAALPGLNLWKIVTPATADDGDTIDFSSYCSVANTVSCFAYGATDGGNTCVMNSTTGITIPGSTDNEARTIYLFGFQN